MDHRSRVLVVLLVATAALGAPPATGQTAPVSDDPEATTYEPPATSHEQAADLFDQGMALFEDENWAGALAAFQRAYDLSPSYIVLFNIGACRKALHDYPGAIDAFEAYLRDGADQIAPAKRAETLAVLAELRALVATVIVRVEANGAEVLVDGEVRGVTPLADGIRLGAGDHVIGARMEGTVPAEEHVALVGGETRTVELTLRAGGPAPTAGGAPSEPDGGSRDRTMEEEGVSQTWFWTAVGLTGALAIGGAVTGGMTLVEKDDFENAVTRCQDGDLAACSDGNAVADRHDAYKLATNILLPAAGAAAAAALVLFFFTEFGDGEAPPATVIPTAGDGTLGISASFAF